MGLDLFSKLPEIDETYQRGFRSDAIARINRVRHLGEIDEVRGDEELQAFVVELLTREPSPGDLPLDEVFARLQERFPGAQYLAANLVTARDRETLLDKLAGWNAVANPEFDTINTAVFASGRRVGALGIMAKRLPPFSLEAANTTGGRFYNTCPHCHEIHALQLERYSRTLILSCPHCDLPFDVLASDSQGRIRRANDYFEGFSLMEPATPGTPTPEERIVALWSRIAERCDYVLDQDYYGEPEVWKGSSETWHDAAGDCEDTAILLADVLISAGFDARVAIGWNGNIGQHAWVAVRIESGQYILESTLQGEITTENLVPVSEASAFYLPEQVFDRDRLYFSESEPDAFRADYFAPDLWREMPPPREPVDPRSFFSRTGDE